MPAGAEQDRFDLFVDTVQVIIYPVILQTITDG